jgi:hypothetical protein
MIHRLLLLASLFLLATPVFGASPYTGEESRGIKALSERETNEYLTGKGMGFAKAAELNGYPGPAHVLELAGELGLSAAQKQKTEGIFHRMQERATAAGKRLVEEERRLDSLFAAKAISPAMLRERVKAIAALQGKIRDTHLQAHLEEVAVLSADQVTQYWHLRGYGHGDAAHPHQHAK